MALITRRSLLAASAGTLLARPALARFPGWGGKASGTPTPPPPTPGPVANRTSPLNASITDGSAKQFNSRSWHMSTEAIASLRVVLPNWIAAVTETDAGVGTTTLSASIEYPASTFTQITFSAATSAALAGGAQILSDNITVAIPAATKFWIRVHGTGSTVGVLCRGNIGDVANGDCYETAASGLADKTLSGTIAGTASNLYLPVAILGAATNKTAAVLGDSRAAGYPNDIPSSGNIGDCGGVGVVGLGWLNLATSFDLAAWFVASHANRAALVAYCGNVIIEYGINDCNSGITEAQLRTDLTTIAGYFPTTRVFLTTMEPFATSTDAFATLVNQTPIDPANTKRVANNDWRRTTPTGFNGFFEIADLVESSRNSGKWKVDGTPNKYTSDGVHDVAPFAFDLIRASGAISAGVFA